jgi:hypothetical protein
LKAPVITGIFGFLLIVLTVVQYIREVKKTEKETPQEKAEKTASYLKVRESSV